MSLDKLRIPKLNDSSKKLILMKQTKSKIDLFVEKTKKTRNKKGRKVSGEMVETRSQKVSEDKRTNWKKNHPGPAQDENQAGRGTEGYGTRRLTSESTPI